LFVQAAAGSVSDVYFGSDGGLPGGEVSPSSTHLASSVAALSSTSRYSRTGLVERFAPGTRRPQVSAIRLVRVRRAT
jgi:hypothetical protein